MNKKSLRLLVLNPALIFVGILFFSPLSAGLSAPSYKPGLKHAMTLYTAGVYGQAYDAFRNCLLAEPQNPRYYYYMGNCLLKLGYVEPALSCFRRSVKIGTDIECNIHAMRALETWVPYLESQKKLLTSSATIAAQNDFRPNFFGNEPEAKVSDEALERRNRLIAQKDQALKNAKTRFDREVQDLDRKLAQDQKDVPRYIYLANGKRTNNPDYDNTLDGLKRDYQNRKMDLQAGYQKNVDELGLHFDALLANEDSMYTNFKSQLRGAQSASNKLTPINSGLYIRNYINLSGSEEESPPPPPLVELTAKAKSLTVPAAKSEKDKR